MTRNFQLEQVLEAIQGTGGIMSAIARRLACDWKTAEKYCLKWATTRNALENEKEDTLDLAESILRKNLEIAGEIQTEQGELVDTGDAKWILSRTRKGKERGYAERQEVTGADGNTLSIKLTGNVSPEDF